MKPIVLFDIDHTLFDTEKLRPFLPRDHSKWKTKKLPFRKCLYPEVERALVELKKQFDPGIFSIEATKGLQRAKIKGSGIENLFLTDLIFINTRISSLVDQIAPTASSVRYVVDDRLDKLKAVKERYRSISTVHMRRGPYGLKKSKYRPDHSVVDLQGFLDIVS